MHRSFLKQKHKINVLKQLASEKTRIERITKRDNITVEEAKKRLSSQFSEDYFKSNCDFVIYNNDEDDIDREIDDILHSLGF